jgi:orotidine-5'-phosphate decarboxylase
MLVCGASRLKTPRQSLLQIFLLVTSGIGCDHSGQVQTEGLSFAHVQKPQ